MISQERAESLLGRVHVAISRADPGWMEKALSGEEIPAETLAEAVAAVLRVNGLQDISETDRKALAHWWDKAQAGDLAKIVRGGEKSASKRPSGTLQKKGGTQ